MSKLDRGGSSVRPKSGLGRDDVDEHCLESFPGSEVSATASGKIIHHKDGPVILEPYVGDHCCPANLGSAGRNRIGIACSSSIRNVGMLAWIA